MSESTPQPSIPASSTSAIKEFFAERQRKQLGLFAASAGFFALSAFITRRSLVRRYKITTPNFYHPSNHPMEVNGALEAFEALNIATVNVLSVSMMLTSGALWAFDISSIEDIRRSVRKRFGMNLNQTNQGVEEDLEEWFATVLERKDKKDNAVENVTTILEKIAEKEKGKNPFQKERDEEKKS